MSLILWLLQSFIFNSHIRKNIIISDHLLLQVPEVLSFGLRMNEDTALLTYKELIKLRLNSSAATSDQYMT